MSDDGIYNVLFLCTGNSARSILGEAVLNHVAQGRFQGFSAGSTPKDQVNPMTLEVLQAAGISTEGLRSKAWDEFAVPGAPYMDFVFTVCDNAAGEACPVWPGQPMTAHWGIEDPAAVEGPNFRRMRRSTRRFASCATASARSSTCRWPASTGWRCSRRCAASVEWKARRPDPTTPPDGAQGAGSPPRRPAPHAVVAAVVGSGMMAERLTGDAALALLCNTLPTGAMLVVLIAMLGSISGAHLNPAVTAAIRTASAKSPPRDAAALRHCADSRRDRRDRGCAPDVRRPDPRSILNGENRLPA